MSGRPSTVSIWTRGLTSSNRRGTMSICTSTSSSDRTSASVSSDESVENAITIRSTSSSRDELRQALGRT